MRLCTFLQLASTTNHTGTSWVIDKTANQPFFDYTYVVTTKKYVQTDIKRTKWWQGTRRLVSCLGLSGGGLDVESTLPVASNYTTDDHVMLAWW